MNHFCKKNLAKDQKKYINKVLLLFASFSDMCIFYLAGISIAFYIAEADYEVIFKVAQSAELRRSRFSHAVIASLIAAPPVDDTPLPPRSRP